MYLHFNDCTLKVPASSTQAHRLSSHSRHHLDLIRHLVLQISVGGVKFFLAVKFWWATLSHKNISPQKFNLQNIMVTKIPAFTVVQLSTHVRVYFAPKGLTTLNLKSIGSTPFFHCSAD